MLKLPILACTVVCALLGASAVEAKPPRCDRNGGDKTLSAGKVVVLVNRNFEDKDVWSACWRPTGALHRIATVHLDSHGRPSAVIDGFRANGAWLAWGQVAASASKSETLSSRNVRTGKVGHVVRGRQAGPISPTNGPLPNLDPPFYVLATNGNFGWIAKGRTEDGQDRDAVYVPDGEGSRQVDVGPNGSITKLRVEHRRLRWENAGETRFAQL